MLKKEFLPIDLAFKIKEKGFKDKCFMWYCKGGLHDDLIFTQYEDESYFCYAPLYQQALNWFRKKYKIDVIINSNINDEGLFYLITISQLNKKGLFTRKFIHDDSLETVKDLFMPKIFKSYQSAQNYAINYILTEMI